MRRLPLKLLLMADGRVGLAIFEWLATYWGRDLGLVVVVSDNPISTSARQNGIPCAVFESEEKILAEISALKLQFDLGLMAWWPKIIRQPILSLPSQGFINTHPSLLPHNRGKHYNFWALVEEAPFGVTLHKVDGGIDTGDIVAQRRIPYSWEDTGATLYEKAQSGMVSLFKKAYADLRNLNFNAVPQRLDEGSFHRASELDEASRIELDQRYTGRELLNRLRARTFRPHPACWFTDGGDVYEVRVEIEKRLT